MDEECTIYIGNLSEKVTEELLYELCLQAGPVKTVTIPADKESGKQKPFAFVEFADASSVPYSIELLNEIRLFKKFISVQSQSHTLPYLPHLVGVHSLCIASNNVNDHINCNQMPPLMQNYIPPLMQNYIPPLMNSNIMPFINSNMPPFMTNMPPVINNVTSVMNNKPPLINSIPPLMNINNFPPFYY